METWLNLVYKMKQQARFELTQYTNTDKSDNNPSAGTSNRKYTNIKTPAKKKRKWKKTHI